MSTQQDARYVVITPCRNEESHIGETIRTVVEQSLPPSLWIIVDDGSTDGTLEILQEAAREHDFIRVVQRSDRGHRSVGSGVVKAFYAGLEDIDLEDFSYLCKLDGDLELPPLYFERMIAEMESNPRLGNFSGKVYLRLPNGRLVYERMGDENAIGAAKFYRRQCFQEIDGFVPHPGWDGIDGHMCRMRGWIARSRNEADLRIVHRRLMGSSAGSIWAGRKRWGALKWFQGSALYYVLGVFVYRLVERPFVVGALGILVGYLGAMLRRDPQFEVPGFRKTLRDFERRSLFQGKDAAIRSFESQSDDRS